MADVASRYGETSTSAYLLPVSVDGLIVVASICLVELAARLRTVESPSTVVAPIVAGPIVSFDNDDHAVNAELIARASEAMTAYRTRTGQAMTAGQLAALLRITNATAAELLTRINPTRSGTPARARDPGTTGRGALTR
jgi:hypothetical protein